MIAAATLSRPLGGVVPSLQLKLVDQARNVFVGGGVPSTGSTTLYLNAGLGYRTRETLTLAPLYRHVNEDQLAPRESVLVGITKVF